MSGREIVARLLEEAGLVEKRFIPVQEGGKRSTVKHQKAKNRYGRLAPLGQNYGVYAGPAPDRTAWLIEVDIDDYSNDTDDEALAAVRDLPETLRVATPHTDGEMGGHRYYRVTDGNAGERISEVAGVTNPAPSWGELRVHNQYVVGPGSQLDGCDKAWCDKCATSEGGKYVVETDLPVAEITVDDLLDVLAADGYGECDENKSVVDYGDNTARRDNQAERVAERYDFIRDYLASGSDDRSGADFHVCCLMIEHGVPEAQARELLDSNPHTKVSERGNDYWRDTWQTARSEVGDEADSRSLSKVPSAGVDDESLPRPDLPLLVRNGGYAKRVDEDKVTQITNFRIEVVTRLQHEDDTKQYRLRIHPQNSDPYEVTVEPVIFNERRKFVRKVPTGWDTTFSGSQTDLNRLKQFIGSQGGGIRKATKQIGLHGSEWVSPAGSLTATGWSDNPDTVFVGEDSPLKAKWGPSPGTDSGYDQETVSTILKLLPKIRGQERFLPVFGWFYSTPLRPLIMEWEKEFNLLNVIGDTGAGKTATLEAIWAAFGMEFELLRADGTPFPIMKALASSNALPVVVDEYKPSDMRDSRLDQLHSYLRTSTRGGIEQKGNPDMSVDSYHLQAPACIAGEQPLQGPAEERRSILTTFTRDATVTSETYARPFVQLIGGEFDGEHFDGHDLHEHAVAYYRWIVSLDADALREKWTQARETVMETLANNDKTGLDDIVIQGFQTVVFGCYLYRSFCHHMGVNPNKTPVTDSAISDTVLYLAEEGSGAEHRSHLDRFIGLTSRAAATDYLKEGKHYTIKNRNGGRTRLVVDLTTGFDQVTRYVRDHDVSGEDVLDNLGDYRSRIRDAEDRDDSYILDRSKKTREIGRGIEIDVAMAEDSVQAFSIRRFTDPDDLENPVIGTRGRIGNILMEKYDSGDEFSVAEMAGKINVKPSEVKHTLGKLANEGTIEDLGDQRFRYI